MKFASSSGSNLSLLATSMTDAAQKRAKESAKLATGGAEAAWSDKTSVQIDVSITNTNKISRMEGFQKNNKVVESRLRTQVAAIEDFMKLAREIQENFMPGSYPTGANKPGLAAMQQHYVSRFLEIGNRINPVSGEYAFGGIAGQNAPIASFPAPGNPNGLAEGASVIHSSAEYGVHISGSFTAYINDEGDTINLTASGFSDAVLGVYTTIFQLSNSVTGYDAAADQASASAALAQKSMLTAYYQTLDQINLLIEQDDELSDAIGEAIKLREEFTEDRIEELLARVTQLSVMEEIRQHLFAQESRKAKDAADMLRQG